LQPVPTSSADGVEDLMRVLRDVVLTMLVLVIVGGLAAYLFARSGGLSARRQPGTLEYAVAVRLRNTSAAAQAGNVVNPLAGQPDAWRAATLHYAGRCAMCHNVNGKGATVIASNVSPPPPDLTQDATQRLSDAQLFAIIRDGVRWTAMPSWREMHSDEELWQLVALVRHLPHLKLEELDLLNPAVALVPQPEPLPTATTGTQPPY
jgi:mono/diheme cytochrome c family protein